MTLQKGQGQNNRSWAQLHHPNYLLKPWLKGQSQTVQWIMVSTKQSDPRSWTQCVKKYKFSWPCKKVKGQNNRYCDTIIPENCLNHEWLKPWRSIMQHMHVDYTLLLLTPLLPDWRSKSNGTMNYGVHKVTPVHAIIHGHNDNVWMP